MRQSKYLSTLLLRFDAMSDRTRKKNERRKTRLYISVRGVFNVSRHGSQTKIEQPSHHIQQTNFYLLSHLKKKTTTAFCKIFIDYLTTKTTTIRKSLSTKEFVEDFYPTNIPFSSKYFGTNKL